MISYEHLQELQRFAELGRLSASLLHEISNPLAAALVNLELSDERSAAVRRARRDIRLLRRYVEAARQQIRRQGQPTAFWIQPQIKQLKHVLLPLAHKGGARLDIGAVPPCRLHGDPVKFQHIISNLVVNAIEAYGDKVNQPAKPASLVRLTFTRRGNCLTINVTDWGEGIQSVTLPYIFDTFYTSKAASGHGLGLGLSIVKRYVTADFRGTVTASSSPLDGTCFSVKLPILPQ
jgi:two-component system, NtrC family, C4-dicarboxylate transport sensor histidine kinase DctB